MVDSTKEALTAKPKNPNKVRAGQKGANSRHGHPDRVAEVQRQIDEAKIVRLSAQLTELLSRRSAE
jgi:hypothetical protein